MTARLGFCLAGLLLVPVACHRAADSGGILTSRSFRIDALLQRFDSDGDGSFSREEAEALREAFGGIDVPVLPLKPHRYASAERPELRGADNTPEGNPTTDAGAALGRVLFHDRSLSRNGATACASCHRQERGFADPNRYSIGFEGGLTGRNAMGLVNLRYSNLRGLQPGFFWDERAPTLEAQALIPIQDELEMGMELPALEEKLARLPYYPPLFEEAFGSRDISSERIARALAQFMRSLVSFDSKFDRAAPAAGSRDLTEDFDGFTDQENLGKSLFIEGVQGVAEFGCAFCHIPPTFGMPKSFNNGLDLEYADRGLGALDRPSNDPFTPSNDGKFKAPSLRNIELTAPYMHDGRFETLEQVIDHYSGGVHPHENLSLAFREEVSSEPTSGFRLNAEAKAALAAFLKTLTDEEFIADPAFSDPFLRGR